MALTSEFSCKVLYTASLYSAFFCLGWARALIGPAFGDLLLLCNVDLETGSWMLTVYYIGYALGSLTAGFLYDKIDKKLVFTITHFGLACTFFVIPWCTIFGVMVFVYFIQGALNGVVDSVAHAVLVTLWSKHGKIIYMGVSCIFCIGGMISPLITAPFIRDPDEYNTEHENNTTISDVIHNKTEYVMRNTTYRDVATVTDNVEFKLFIPFTISGILYVFVSIFFLVVYFLDHDQIKSDTKDTKCRQTLLPWRPRVCALAGMSLLFGIHDAIDSGQGSYLSLFCVTYLQWSKSDAALIISIGYICVLVSGLVGVILVYFLDIRIFTSECLLTALVAQTGMTLSSYYFHNIGVWISFLTSTFVRGNVFSLLYCWTNEYITEMTGKISSVFMISGMTASAVNPIVVGHLMKEVSKLWFCYFFLIESGVLVAFLLVLLFLTHSINKRYGKVSERTSNEKQDGMLSINEE